MYLSFLTSLINKEINSALNLLAYPITFGNFLHSQIISSFVTSKLFEIIFLPKETLLDINILIIFISSNQIGFLG